MTNPLKALGEAGQAPWLDYLHRHILETGELERRIRDDGLRGLDIQSVDLREGDRRRRRATTRC